MVPNKIRDLCPKKDDTQESCPTKQRKGNCVYLGCQFHNMRPAEQGIVQVQDEFFDVYVLERGVTL